MNEAELLFSRMLKCDRMSLYLKRKIKLGAERGAFASLVLKKRISGYPLQYILGKADFFGIDFLVNESVLIPRPETEILVEYLVNRFSGFKRAEVLDIGAGSGCIAISLVKALPGARVLASDKSRAALK
ncbi:MAG: methyltransferase, partial [Candidatus Omnitrophota bacterium]